MPIPLHTRRGRKVLLAILGVPCLLIAVAAVAAVRAAHQVNQSLAWVQDSHDTRAHLDALERLVLEAESSQRGFLLTGNDSFLQPYAEAAHAAAVELNALAEHLAQTTAYSTALSELRGNATAKLADLRAVMDIAGRGGRGEASAIVSAGSGEALMQRFAGTIASLGETLAGVAAQNQAQLQRDVLFRSRLMLVLLAANLVFSGVIVTLAWRFARMHAFVRMCSWSRTIEHEGEWITFEAYLQRRFGLQTSHGISPAEVEKLGWARSASARSGHAPAPPTSHRFAAR